MHVPTRRKHAPGQKQWFGIELGWLVVRTQFLAPFERDAREREPVKRQRVERESLEREPFERERVDRNATYDAE